MSEYENGNQNNHRLVMIMEKLNKYGRVDVQEIAQELDVSTVLSYILHILCSFYVYFILIS